MKGTKKILSFILSFLMILGFAVTSHVSAFAASTSDKQSTYKEVLDNANSKYHLNLGFEPVDTTKVTLEEYKETVLSISKQQRALLDFIESRKSNAIAADSNMASTTSEYTKTVTKDCYNTGGLINITATYTVENHRIGSVISSDLGLSATAVLSNYYLTNISSPSYSKIDSNRTLAIQYTATIHYDLFSFNNVTCYAEFG